MLESSAPRRHLASRRPVRSGQRQADVHPAHRAGSYTTPFCRLPCEHVFVSILHADADCFFASVEQRDEPRLRGRPLVVATWVVMAASYEARSFSLAAPCTPVRPTGCVRT